MQRMVPVESKIQWPHGKSFAFTIVDDTDHATVNRVKPIYDLLEELDMRTTKTLWVYPFDAGRFSETETLGNAEYRDFCLQLLKRGFELAWHGARGISSKRDITLSALERYREVVGAYPTIHINHAQNEDNLYWVYTRLFNWQKALHRLGIKKYNTRGTGHGASPGSPWFWGDFAKAHIKYVRGSVFKDINTLALDPEMPYHEKRFPYVNAWFSGSDGGGLDKFVRLIQKENVDKLILEGGLCMVYTHFGTPGFIDETTGEVNPEFAERLRYIAAQNGWFAPAGEILDYLAAKKGIAHTNSLRRWWRTRNLLSLG